MRAEMFPVDSIGGIHISMLLAVVGVIFVYMLYAYASIAPRINHPIGRKLRVPLLSDTGMVDSRNLTV